VHILGICISIATVAAVATSVHSSLEVNGTGVWDLVTDDFCPEAATATQEEGGVYNDTTAVMATTVVGRL
jgi:hypothetical protein